jgi:hypothetical protein
VGKGGGFVMIPTINEVEACDPALIAAWVDATKEYGAYEPG